MHKPRELYGNGGIEPPEEGFREDYELELQNRMKNLLWTVSGDYKLEMKADLAAFRRSKYIALYDSIKQGAFARYYDKELMGLYLVKKVFLQADEVSLTALAQLCIEEAVGGKLEQERPGVRNVRNKALRDLMDLEFERMSMTTLGRLRAAVFQEALRGTYPVEKRIDHWRRQVYQCRETEDTMELIRIIDSLYNQIIDPKFEQVHGGLKSVLAVTMQELAEYDWQDFLTEELYEEALEEYVKQLTERMTDLDDKAGKEEEKKEQQVQKKITVISPELLEKSHTYVELNYGKSYLSPTEEKRVNHLLCRDIHSDCSLYFTEGILKNPVKRNYQLEYAKRLKSKNIFLYHDKHRIVKRNIYVLTEILRKAMVLRNETVEVLSDSGNIVPSRLWRVGRSQDARLFTRELKGDTADFVVDVLIDASGSQMSRQGDVALQGYIISEALSNVEIPHRVMSFCTFWDYTILQRFREYDDDRKENANLFNYVTSSNNRDGLAIKAAGYGLLQREEEKKILIVLSDGRPYDVIVNRPNARNPQPYQGEYAVRDTGHEIRKLRNLGVSVLGVFAGEEKDLKTEKKIFGKDFAYIRDIAGFSRIVGRYLTKQLEEDV